MACQLTIREREQIAQFHSQGLSKAEIGRRLGRHRSTIVRELVRNGDGANYWASDAHEKAQTRRRRRVRKLDDPSLSVYVRRGLLRHWSPEQIAGRSRRDFQRQPRRRLSHSTIYRWIAADPQRRFWESFLRFGNRRLGPETRGKLRARADISGRPNGVDERRRYGDWEGDTVVGRQHRGGLVTLVERKSGFALAGKVGRRQASNVANAMVRRFTLLPPGLRRTITFDNGKEFAEHERITHATGLDIYFARPYHAWERGSNESFNGLLRQFFPKGTDFRGTSPREVKDVLDLLNDRPRKRLGYKTPREVLGRYYPVAFQM
jgi:transposase, IS30 family